MDSKSKITKNFDQKDAQFAYEKLLQLRDLDNQLMWTRINILIVFQGVLLAAIVAGFDHFINNFFYLLLLVVGFGIFSSVVLCAVAKGGSWWVTHWEKHLADIEQSAIGEIDIFRTHHGNIPEIKSEWKKEGYVSARDWIQYFTYILPFIWIAILLYLMFFKF